MNEPWQHGYVEANGIRFHYVEAGEGPLVLLLHGFPEFWYSWRHQIGPLAERFRVVAPDLRGYNETDKPRTGYDVATLVEDTVALAGAFGERRFRLAGHDWGGAIAWATAARHPAAVERLVILNAPHPTAMAEALGSSLTQLRRSWYMFFFQLPFLPEWYLARDDYKMVARALVGNMVHRERLSREDVEQFRKAMAKPGTATAAINYYRAAFRDALRNRLRVREVRVDVPTLVVWGERDAFLGKELTERLDRWVRDVRVEYLPDAGHWVQQDEPETVTRLRGVFLG
jgi:pimeloyl-ACP methyl ester carboxylesterase